MHPFDLDSPHLQNRSVGECRGGKGVVVREEAVAVVRDEGVAVVCEKAMAVERPPPLIHASSYLPSYRPP